MTPDAPIDYWVRVGRRSFRHYDGHEAFHDGWLYKAVRIEPDGRRRVCLFSRLSDAKRWAETGELQ